LEKRGNERWQFHHLTGSRRGKKMLQWFFQRGFRGSGREVGFPRDGTGNVLEVPGMSNNTL